MRRRNFLLGVLSGATVWPYCVKAQQTKPIVAVISPLSAQAAASNIEALRQGLHDLGLDETRDFTFALHFLDGNLALAPIKALKIVALKVDVIVAGATLPVIEAYRATRAIPIVMIGFGAAPGFNRG